MYVNRVVTTDTEDVHVVRVVRHDVHLVWFNVVE